MFWSKIVYFVVGVTAALCIGMALTMPRPAQRKVLEAEEERLVRARSEVEMLLRANAREWVDLASDFARYPAPAGQQRLKIDAVLETASRADNTIPDGAQADGRDTLQYILGQVSGAQKPEVAVALDKWGRVVASVGVADRKVGDDLSGYFLVRDALRGYLRDDVWYEGGKLYRMSAAPVINRQLEYVGAIVLGDEVDLSLCKKLEESVGAHVAFFVHGDMVQTSINIPSDEIKKNWEQTKGQPEPKEGGGLKAFDVQKGDVAYRVALKPLPGEAGAQDGFIAVFSQRPAAIGFFGTLEQVTKDDLGFGHFPWIALGLVFVLMVLGGLALMWLEADRPIRRLAEDAVRLGKGDVEKLAEDHHRGKLGSIARSVNIALEKVLREAKARGKDLGAVLGPPPDDGVFGSQPGTRKSGSHQSPFAPPPPAAFSFEAPPSSSPLGAALGAMPPAPPVDFPPPPPPRPAPREARTPASVTPPPAARSQPGGRGAPPPIPTGGTPRPGPVPSSPAGASPVRLSNALPLSQVPSLDDDLLAPTKEAPGRGRAQAPASVDAEPDEVPEDVYYRQVFDDFVELKRKCGESTDGLTYEKFSLKLKQNKEQLVTRYACKAVKFQVYVKDGKAALKATPVKS